MYQINNLSYKIAKQTILKNLNINIKTNSFLSIVGANGCGKSTLMKLINKNLDFYDGLINLDDKDIKNYSNKQLANKRSVLNQSFSFEYNLKAIDIIKMGFYFTANISLDKKNKITSYVVDKLSLHSLLEKNYIHFSGGEKQKIQFARIIVQVCASCEKEKYLFLDEPTLNLDIHYQYKILNLVKDLISDFNIGVCAILHDINQAYIYSDEVAMIQDNKIKYYGNTKDVLTSSNIYDIFKVQSDFIYSNNFNKEILVTYGSKN